VVVDHVAAAAQDDVANPDFQCDEDGGLPVLGVAEEGVGMCGGLDCVDGDLHVTGGCVLEADGAGDSGDKLAMDLALGGACADGAPTDQAGNVLGGDHVRNSAPVGRPFSARSRSRRGLGEAVVDLVGLVQIRIVDEALPSDGGAGLLKIRRA